MARTTTPPAWSRRAAAAVLAFALVWAAAPASAGDGRATSRHGECRNVSRWRLTVRVVDTGTFRVRFAIGGGAAGQAWNVFMDHNGEGFFAGSKVSREGGILVVRRETADRPGEDTIRAGAHNTVTGETCLGRIAV